MTQDENELADAKRDAADLESAEQITRSFAEKAMNGGQGWALDPRYILTLCDAVRAALPGTVQPVAVATLNPSTVKAGVKELEAAMRQLTRVDVAQYLLSNTRTRSNGALKALSHTSLTVSYVAVMRGVDPDRVRQRCQADYAAVHDATADELTNRLDEAIGFNLDAYVDDDLAERFFQAFHRIAIRVLSPSIRSSLIPATIAGERAEDWVFVPREPTEAMCTAGFDAAMNGDIYAKNGGGTIVVETAIARDVWRAMLAANPRLPGEGSK